MIIAARGQYGQNIYIRPDQFFQLFPCLETSFCPSSKVLSGGTYSSQNGKIVPNRLKNEPGFLLYIILFSTISSDIQRNFVIDIRRKIPRYTSDNRRYGTRYQPSPKFLHLF